MPESWSQIECEAIVADYLAMLTLELRGEPYSKARHRRALMSILRNRSEGSIEYKHQNISAVLLNAGHAYIPGYKPAWNYQALLERIVLERIAADEQQIVQLENEQIQVTPGVTPVQDWRALFVPPPEKDAAIGTREPRPGRTTQIDYSEREARNRLLGERGEAFVLEVERKRLASLGREDLLDDIEWTSKTVGDGTGYDIRSFEGATDEQLFIEVKTTNSGIAQPFLISSNEVTFSESNAERYALYRVFKFKQTPSIYALPGRISRNVNLDPTQYRGSFRT